MRCWPVNVPYTLQGLPEQVEEPATNPNGLIAQREEPRQWVLVPNRNRSDSISLEDIFEHVQPFIEPSVDEIKIRLVEQIISSCIASYVAVYSLGESNTKQYYSFLISEIFFDCFLKSKTVFQLTDILSCHMQLNKAALVALCVSDVSRLFISCLIVRYASPNLTLTHIVTYLATRGTLMAFLSARRLRSQIVDSFTS
ncbi:MAG TPA: hypothetical protein VJK48_00045 [Chlamydiales bacterium]|nr:hypothetical protein [Chlamydiales bacterium]